MFFFFFNFYHLSCFKSYGSFACVVFCVFLYSYLFVTFCFCVLRYLALEFDWCGNLWLEQIRIQLGICSWTVPRLLQTSSFSTTQCMNGCPPSKCANCSRFASWGISWNNICVCTWNYKYFRWYNLHKITYAQLWSLEMLPFRCGFSLLLLCSERAKACTATWWNFCQCLEKYKQVFKSAKRAVGVGLKIRSSVLSVI